MRQYKEGKELWDILTDIPVNDNEQIDIDFKDNNGNIIFEKGTDKYEIWHWFEETFNDFILGDEVT